MERMKIVRCKFKITGSNRTYFFDRPYNSNISDQENCDDLLKELLKLVEQSKPLAAMKGQPDNTQVPVIINPSNIIEFVIINVAIYQTKESDNEVKAEVVEE